jgi:YidC/Oxa1 family membrane protein insertase
MKWKSIVWTCVIVFVGFCAIRIWKTGLFSCDRCRLHGEAVLLAAVPDIEKTATPDLRENTTEEKETLPAEINEFDAAVFSQLSAVSGKEETVTLGTLYEFCQRTTDPAQYKYQIELTTRGAAVKSVTLSEFNDRDPDNPKPFVLLNPILAETSPIYSLTSRSFRIAGPNASAFPDQAFPLQRLNWMLLQHDQDSAVFEARLGRVETRDGQRVLAETQIRLQKTYRIRRGSYDLTCELTMENLTGQALQTVLEMQGTAAMTMEDIRTDERNLIAAYRAESGSIESRTLGYPQIRGFVKELNCPQKKEGFALLFEGIGNLLKKIFGSKDPKTALLLKSEKANSHLVWAAAANKYFAAIVRPVQEQSLSFLNAEYHDSDLCAGKPSDKAAASYLLQTAPISLAPKGKQTLSLDVFLGPKDKRLFDKNETYRTNAYFQTFAMRSCCCCPSFVTQPLAFAIMWLMTMLYKMMGPWGNYGVVIMVLVFLMRLVLHPITKKSQVTMMKVQKLGPRIQEVQKKYKGNPQEMHRQMAEVYQQAGMTQFSPMVGMLPMFLQMPIWIALWTAVYTSIDLRGAGFLPVWITDLSAPDALIRFPRYAFTIPLIGLHIDSLNLLPLFMGLVMYLQQKLTPQSQPDPSRPELAQQQKIMMIMLPLMLYNGPSGVNLYIMASIGAGVIEQMVVRKHLQEQEAEKEKGLVPVTSKTGGKFKKKKPKPFFREYK